MILSAIAPPARNECAPIISGSIPFYWSFKALDAVFTARTIYPLVTAVHEPWRHTSQRKLFSVPSLLRMCYTLHDRGVTAPLIHVDYWCNVCPMLPFFWFEIFNVAESVSRSLLSTSYQERIFPFFQNPMS